MRRLEEPVVVLRGGKWCLQVDNLEGDAPAKASALQLMVAEGPLMGNGSLARVRRLRGHGRRSLYSGFRISTQGKQ